MSLPKCQNGISVDALHLRFLHGNISYLVAAVVLSSKEVTEPAADILTIAGISISIMKNGCQSNLKKINKLFQNQENHRLHSIIKKIKDSTFSVAGPMIG